MKILVACEFSGTVRQAFRKRGHDAWSCDLLPADDGSEFHIQGDCREHLEGWDLMIMHPPCQHLAVSGARWFKDKKAEQAEALAFVRTLMDAPCQRWALENPISVISSKIKKPDQIIQPWMFGHGESKATCLWLKGLPLLQPTEVLTVPKCGVWNNQTPSGQNKLGPSPDRWKLRSKTYEGIAEAMASQWGSLN